MRKLFIQKLSIFTILLSFIAAVPLLGSSVENQKRMTSWTEIGKLKPDVFLGKYLYFKGNDNRMVETFHSPFHTNNYDTYNSFRDLSGMDTECESVTAPWSEDFEEGEEGAVIALDCWNQEYVTGNEKWKFVTENNNGTITPHGGSLMAEFIYQDDTPRRTKLVTPSIDMTALNVPQLTFYFANVSFFSGIDELRVYYKASSSDESWTLIPGAEFVDEHTQWEKVEIILPEASGATDYQIAFEGKSNWGNGLNLDDISVDEGPDCIEPISLEALPAFDGAEITWVGVGNSDSWEIIWGEEGFNPDNSEEIDSDTSNTESYTITGLDSDETYDVYVRTLCDDDEVSSWSFKATFTTLIKEDAPWLESFASSSVPAGWATDFFISNSVTQLNPTDGYILYRNLTASFKTANAVTVYVGNISDSDIFSFDYKLANRSSPYAPPASGAADIKVEIQVYPDDTWTELGTESFNGDAGWQEMTYGLSDYDGEIVRFRITADRNSGNFYIGLDNFRVTEAPTCDGPSALTLESVSTDEAEISWTAGGSESQWKVSWGTPGYTPGDANEIDTDTSNTNSYTIEDLEGSSSYDVYVRALCSGGGSSYWVGPLGFDTECESVTAPWSENFESGTNGAVIALSCWDQEYVTGNEKWKFVTENNNGTITPHGGSLMAEFIYQDDTPRRTKLVTPSIDMTALNVPQLTFYFANVSWGSSDELRVYYKASSSDESWTLIPGAEFIDEHTQWEKVEIILPEASGATDYQIAFEAKSNYARGLNLDDISVDEGPDCIEPISLEALPAFDGAEITWVGVGNSDSWEIIWGEEGFNPDNSEEIDSDTSNTESYTITGLGSDETYDVYVRTLCDDDEVSSWSFKATFTTLIKEDAPWLESFVSSSVPAGWATDFFINNSVTQLNPTDGYILYRNLTASFKTANAVTVYVGNISDSDIFSFDYKLANRSSPYAPPASGAADIKVEIQVYPDDTWTELGTESFNGDAGWQEMTYGLSDYDGEIVRFRITADRNSGNFYIGLDNFKVAEAPITCYIFTNASGDGNWGNDDNWYQESVPGPNDCVIIPDGMDMPTISNGVHAFADEITIKAGGQVTIESGGSLTLSGSIINESSASAFVIEDGGNLLQTDSDAINTGDILVKKTFNFSAERNQYNFVISPVIGQAIKDIYDGTEYVIGYDETNNYFYDAGDGEYNTNNPAKGFAIKEALGEETETVSGEFKGSPFNGDAGFELSRTEGNSFGYNLVGNPYPSNIDLDALYAANDELIDGDFWFWDNRDNETISQQGSGYNGVNYAKYNAFNGTGSAASGAQGSERVPIKYVNTGTAFIVRALETADGEILEFTNNIRTTDGGPGFFGKELDNQKDRYWLTMTAPTDITTMTAVVYFEGGSNEYGLDDTNYTGASDEIFTLTEEHKLTIQGRAPFEIEDVVPLGVTGYTNGMYKISLYDSEGVFEAGQNIYLRDKQMNIIHNLSEGDYEFILPAGENINRFEVIYEEDGGMNINDLLANQVIITKDNDEILIASRIDNIREVQLYDLQGRVVYNNLKVQGKELRIPSKSLGAQVLVAVVKTVKGETLTKKIINR